MNDFKNDFQWSNDQSKKDISTIKTFYYNNDVTNIRRSDESLDKKGVDYIVDLNNGKKETYDVKRRKQGSNKYWKNGKPEIAVEIYSDTARKKEGWTNTANCDYFLFIFEDCKKCFRIPAKLLSLTTHRFFEKWKREYGEKIQFNINNGSKYKSSCIFVPFDEVKVCCQSVAFDTKEEVI